MEPLRIIEVIATRIRAATYFAVLGDRKDGALKADEISIIAEKLFAPLFGQPFVLAEIVNSEKSRIMMRPARSSYFLRRRGHDKSRYGSLVGGVHRRQPCRRLLEVVLAHDGAAKGVAELEAPALAPAASPAAPLASLTMENE